MQPAGQSARQTKTPAGYSWQSSGVLWRTAGCPLRQWTKSVRCQQSRPLCAEGLRTLPGPPAGCLPPCRRRTPPVRRAQAVSGSESNSAARCKGFDCLTRSLKPGVPSWGLATCRHNARLGGACCLTHSAAGRLAARRVSCTVSELHPQCACFAACQCLVPQNRSHACHLGHEGGHLNAQLAVGDEVQDLHVSGHVVSRHVRPDLHGGLPVAVLPEVVAQARQEAHLQASSHEQLRAWCISAGSALRLVCILEGCTAEAIGELLEQTRLQGLRAMSLHALGASPQLGQLGSLRSSFPASQCSWQPCSAETASLSAHLLAVGLHAAGALLHSLQVEQLDLGHIVRNAQVVRISALP